MSAGNGVLYNGKQGAHLSLLTDIYRLLLPA